MQHQIPLFEAPWDHVTHYAGAGTCTLCGTHQTDTLTLEGEDEDEVEVIVFCSGCRSPTTLCALDFEAVRCSDCGANVGPVQVAQAPRACLACVAAGYVHFSHQSEAGLVRWDGPEPDDAFTKAASELVSKDALVRSVNQSDVPKNRRSKEKRRRKRLYEAAKAAQSAQVHVDAEERQLLAVTPPIAYWNDDSGWLACCAAFMVYTGHWTRRDFDKHATGVDGKTLFERTVDNVFGPTYQDLPLDLELAKMFRCRRCQTLRGTLDLPP